MTGLVELVKQVAETFNRHGSFTARQLDDRVNARPSVEVRYIDTGDIAATIWPPNPDAKGNPGWMWLGGQPGMGIRFMLPSATVEELVRAVATHVLDERPKR